MNAPDILRRAKPLLAASVIASSPGAPVFAGPSSHGIPPVAKPTESSPLSFFDGALVLDLEGRARLEIRNNSRDFNDSNNDDNDDAWLINRFRFGIAIEPTSWLKFYAQGQDTREWESERPNIPGVRGNEGGDDFDLRQSYVEIGDSKAFPLSLTVGRQRLNYGDSRLVADSRWNNYGRTFDAVKLRFEVPGLWVEAFASRPVQIKEHVFNDSDTGDDFFGVYASSDALRFQTTDVYFFYRDKGDNQPDLVSSTVFDSRGSSNGAAQRVSTIGTRWKSTKALGAWDYNVEAAFQFGDVWLADRSSPQFDHRAFASHVSGGYTFEAATWVPRLGLGYNYASGDHDFGDGNSESFQNLFPSNHAKFGDMDQFGWRNLHNLRFQLSARPTKLIEVELTYNANWLADPNDFWYRSNGVSTLRTRTPSGQDVRTVGADRFAGHEFDCVVRWKPQPWLNLDAGYIHFFAGGYLRDTGPSDDADFGYVQAQLVF